MGERGNEALNSFFFNPKNETLLKKMKKGQKKNQFLQLFQLVCILAGGFITKTTLKSFTFALLLRCVTSKD